MDSRGKWDDRARVETLHGDTPPPMAAFGVNDSVSIDAFADSEDKTVAVTTLPPASFDMFSDAFHVAKPALKFVVDDPNTSGVAVTMSNAEMMAGNWDDEKGYYKLNIGESIDSRYNVFGYTGANSHFNLFLCNFPCKYYFIFLRRIVVFSQE